MRWLLLPLFAAILWGQAAKAPAKPAAAKPAAAPSGGAERFPIEKLTVAGLTTLPTSRVEEVMGLKAGQLASQADFEKARERLIESGAFQSVGFEYGPSGKGYAVKFNVVEIAQLYPFQVEDLPVSTAQVGAFLEKNDPLFTGKIPGNQVVFDRYAKRIQEYLTSIGKKEEITAKLVAGEKATDVYLLFRPSRPGAQIAEVTFSGNKSIMTPRLQQAVAGVAIGAVYHEQDMRRYLDNSVRPVYEERGYLRVAFPTMYLSKAKDVDGVVVNVNVKEGDVYNLGAVKLQTPVGNTRTLLSEANFREGDIANFTDINAGIERMKEVLRHEGYIRVSSEVDRRVDDAKKTVDLTVKFTPGSQFLFGKLNVEGLDILTEPVIRKMWGDRAGKPYDPAYPAYFLKRVKEEGIFDYLQDTSYNLETHEDAHTVDVTLRFSTKKPSPRS